MVAKLAQSKIYAGYTEVDIKSNSRLSRCSVCGGDIFFYDGCWWHELAELDDGHRAVSRDLGGR